MTKKSVKICPRCKSIKVKTNYRYGLTFLAGTPEIYTCQNCGFTSELFPEAEIETKTKIKIGRRRT